MEIYKEWTKNKYKGSNRPEKPLKALQKGWRNFAQNHLNSTRKLLVFFVVFWGGGVNAI